MLGALARLQAEPGMVIDDVVFAGVSKLLDTFKEVREHPEYIQVHE